MTACYALLVTWLLTAILTLAGLTRPAAIAAIIGVALIAAVVGGAVRDWWRRATYVRVTALAEIDARRHLAAIIPPPADLEFLGPEGGCDWCCDLEAPGDPRECRCETPCQGIDWCNAGGWTTNLIPAVKEEQ